MEYIGLPAAISLLREELAVAQETGHDQQLRFEVASVEMEFLVELRTDVEAKGGVTFGVVTLGAGGKSTRGETHRLKLTLNVKDAATGGGPVDVRGPASRP